MKTNKPILLSFCIVFLLVCISSCLPRRKDLEITPFHQKLSLTPVYAILIKFDECVPGRPLNETVWDNVSGPFWDVKESQQIGFTQHYKPQFFAIPPAILPAVAQSGIMLIDTRIVIPFGNIFSSVFKLAAQNTFVSSAICFDETCVNTSSAANILRVKIEKFFVWEAPLNHLNLYAKGKSIHSQNGKILKEYAFEKSLLAQRLGGVLSTHRKFMKEMNRLSNQFSADLVKEVLENGL